MEFEKRSFDGFLSYSWEDKDVAEALFGWLTKTAGLRIWKDDRNVQGGSSIAGQLPEAIDNCKAYILIASHSSLNSPWVESELDQATHEGTVNKQFKRLVFKIDDCNVGSKAKLKTMLYYEAPQGKISLVVAEKLLSALAGIPDRGSEPYQRKVYVSRGWRGPDCEFFQGVGRQFDDYGFLLIGDSPDQTDFDADRIGEIMAGCGGHVMVLPRREPKNGSLEEAYKFFDLERQIAQDLRLPQWIIAAEDTPLPSSLETDTKFKDFQEPQERERFRNCLEEFAERLVPPEKPLFSFLATSYARETQNTLLASFISRITGYECQLGTRFKRANLAGQIALGISKSRLVLAIIRSERKASDDLELNVNTCVEAGIAIGAGIEPYLFAQVSSEDEGLPDDVPFMFCSYKVELYQNEAELIGLIFNRVRPHRIRIINNELA